MTTTLTGVQAAARTIVFCNKIETCRKVENLLNRGLGGASSGGGALVLAHHAAIDEAVRQRNLKVPELPAVDYHTFCVRCSGKGYCRKAVCGGLACGGMLDG